MNLNLGSSCFTHRGLFLKGDLERSAFTLGFSMHLGDKGDLEERKRDHVTWIGRKDEF